MDKFECATMCDDSCVSKADDLDTCHDELTAKSKSNNKKMEDLG